MSSNGFRSEKSESASLGMSAFSDEADGSTGAGIEMTWPAGADALFCSLEKATRAIVIIPHMVFLLYKAKKRVGCLRIETSIIKTSTKKKKGIFVKKV